MMPLELMKDPTIFERQTLKGICMSSQLFPSDWQCRTRTQKYLVWEALSFEIQVNNCNSILNREKLTPFKHHRNNKKREASFYYSLIDMHIKPCLMFSYSRQR